jgi:hypothetical protein
VNEFTEHSEVDTERAGFVPSVDWQSIDGFRVDDHLPETNDTIGDIGTRAIDAPLLEPEDTWRLDPTREGASVPGMYPERFTPADGADQQRLEALYASDQRIRSWIGGINPGFLDAVRSDDAGRTENCVDCARSVQATLEGRPTAAAAIGDGGLPLKGELPGGGEHPAYTEQAVGRYRETTSYDDIAHRLADTHGSAIVFAQPAEGTASVSGHAFNAVWDTDTRRVLWADGQSGEVGDWPPSHLQDTRPETTAIFFPEPRRYP